MKPKEKLYVSMVKLGTIYKLKYRSGEYIKVEKPNTSYKEGMELYVDEEITEVIPNY